VTPAAVPSPCLDACGMHFVNCGPALVWFQRGERKHVRRPVLGPQQFHVVFDDVPVPLAMGMGYCSGEHGDSEPTATYRRARESCGTRGNGIL
jgi:hypothetical protein